MNAKIPIEHDDDSSSPHSEREIDKLAGEHGDAMKIKLRAPAIEGKANTALCKFLAEKLRIPQRAIVLERGEIPEQSASDRWAKRRRRAPAVDRGLVVGARSSAMPSLIPQLEIRRSHPPLCLNGRVFEKPVWIAAEASFEWLQRCRGKTKRRGLSNC